MKIVYQNYQKIKKSIISEKSTLIDIIKNINNSNIATSFIINKNDHLVGTVTDGDIRRALVKGYGLKTKVIKIMNKKPKIFLNKASLTEANKVCNKLDIKSIPYLKNKKILGLFIKNNNLEERRNRIENKVVIMAGGLGTRLKSLTKYQPKALLRFKSKPLIEYVIDNAKNSGFKNFSISVFYLKEKIKKYFKENKQKKININFITEKKPLGTIGSLALIKNYNKDIIVLNCDVITSIDLEELLRFHEKNKSLMTMAIKHFRYENPYGVIKSKKNQFVSFDEKPTVDFAINAGVYVFSPKIIKIVKNNNMKFIEEIISFLKSKNKKISLFPIYEEWIDLGTDIKRLKKY